MARAGLEKAVRSRYGPHTGILSIARVRGELRRLCCYINPDFSVKMSNNSEFEYKKKKKNKTKKKPKGKARWSDNKMLID